MEDDGGDLGGGIMALMIMGGLVVVGLVIGTFFFNYIYFEDVEQLGQHICEQRYNSSFEEFDRVILKCKHMNSTEENNKIIHIGDDSNE